jgi:hypothetical protein
MTREIKFKFRSVWWTHTVEEINFIEWFVWLSDGDQRDISSGVLLQYTWLKDKNWKDVYEWDLMETWNSNIMWVVFQKWMFVLAYDFWNAEISMDYKIEDYIVVGNIYENYDLFSNAK